MGKNETHIDYISACMANISMVGYFTDHIGLWFIPCILYYI